MKRSEVLKIIEGLFSIASNRTDEDNAENLLSTLEEVLELSLDNYTLENIDE